MRLSEVSDLVMGQSPSSASYNDVGEGLPFYQGKSEFGTMYPTPKKFCTAPKKIAEAGDILISVRAPVGATNLCAERSCIGRGIAAIRPRGINRDFLYFYLKKIESYIDSLGTGVIFKAINKSQLSNLLINKAGISLTEQKKIAHVLSTVQRAIEAQENIIQTTTELKKVLMHKLFTEGTRGEPRKETEIGLIPESWEICSIPDSLVRSQVGRQNQIPSKAIADSGQYPVVDQGQLLVSGYTDESDRLIDFDLPLIIFGDHTRRFKFVDFPFVIGADGTKVLKPDLELFEPKYFFYALDLLDLPSRGYNRHFKMLQERKVPKPVMDEQRDIASMIDTVEQKLIVAESKRMIIQDLFRTFLHSLMTARTCIHGFEAPKIKETP